MKSIILIPLLAIAAAWAQVEASNNKQADNTQQRLMKIEQDLVDALIKGDSSVFERYVAETAMFTDEDGISDKARLVTDLRSGDLKFQSSKLNDMKVQVYGDAAVVTYGSTDKGTYKGKDISGRYRWTDTFVNSNGHWKIVAEQGTRLRQQ
jgi:ketosteroid isomerase-like protein